MVEQRKLADSLSSERVRSELTDACYNVSNDESKELAIDSVPDPAPVMYATPFKVNAITT